MSTINKSLRMLVSLCLVASLTACAGLKEIAQGTVDQFAAADDARSASSSRFGYVTNVVQIPEDAMRLRDPQLAEAMRQLGRKIAKGTEPKARLTVYAQSQGDAEWLIAQVDRGIASSKWRREAVMLPPYVQLTNAYPAVQLYEGIREY